MYLVNGYGTGGLGDLSAKLALKVSTGKATLASAQAEWDAAAAALRKTLTNQLLGQSLMTPTTARVSPAQIAVEVEKEIVKRLGPRPRGAITSTSMTSVVQKSPSGEIIFGGQSVEAGGIKTLHIVGGLALIGLIALAVKGT